MSDSGSYRTILRSSSLIGGASAVNILASIAKMKVVAVLLGPAGIGLVGIYLSLVQTAAAVAALGIGTVGTRQVAAASVQPEAATVGVARRALFWLTMVLAAIGGGAFWLSSGWIAQTILEDASRAAEVAWLSLGVALSVAAASQSALLSGLRRVGDLACLNVGAGLAGAAFGVASLWAWGGDGILTMLLIAPAATWLFGLFYVSRLERVATRPLRLRQVLQEMRTMIRLGVAVMLSGLVTMLGFLVVRVMVQREIGTDALGHFQAAWAISATYLGFVLTAMTMDYAPRLTAAIDDPAAARRLVNEQAEVALLLCAPVLLLMIGCAPWVIHMLYSVEFGPAIGILRWQIAGDILKVMSWPLAFVLLAAGAGKTYLAAEASGILAFVLGVALALGAIGVLATGMAYLAMYVLYLPVVWLLARSRIDFRWSRSVLRQAAALIAAAALVAGMAEWSDIHAAGVSVVLATGFGVFALARLARLIGMGGRIGWLSARLRQLSRRT